MKAISILIFIITLLLFSCKKEENSHKGNRTDTYYFKGTVTDTTNGNSLVGYRLSLFGCHITSRDTIIDNKYSLVHHQVVGNYKGFQCLRKVNVEIFNTEDSLIATINIPQSKWVKFVNLPCKLDTAFIDLKF